MLPISQHYIVTNLMGTVCPQPTPFSLPQTHPPLSDPRQPVLLQYKALINMPSKKSKKQKQTRNLSGLRNQPKASPAPTASSYNPTPPQSHAPSPEVGGYESGLEDDDGDDDDDDLELLIHFDSMKMNLQHEDEHYSDLGDDEDDEGLEEWSGFHSQDLADVMGAMIMDNDPTDLDWMPSRMRKELLRMEKMKTGMDLLTK